MSTGLVSFGNKMGVEHHDSNFSHWVGNSSIYYFNVKDRQIIIVHYNTMYIPTQMSANNVHTVILLI